MDNEKLKELRELEAKEQEARVDRATTALVELLKSEDMGFRFMAISPKTHRPVEVAELLPPGWELKVSLAPREML